MQKRRFVVVAYIHEIQLNKPAAQNLSLNVTNPENTVKIWCRLRPSFGGDAHIDGDFHCATVMILTSIFFHNLATQNVSRFCSEKPLSHFPMYVSAGGKLSSPLRGELLSPLLGGLPSTSSPRPLIPFCQRGVALLRSRGTKYGTEAFRCV
jgi:hypothetical protein